MLLTAPLRLGFTIALIGALSSGCKEMVVPKTDFAKFSECVQAAAKDGIVTQRAAKNACSAKYSKFKLVDVTGTGGFSYCEKTADCSNFSVNLQNPSHSTIVTRVEVVVRFPTRKPVSGFAELLWAEPGTHFSSVITLSEAVSPEDRKDMTWAIPTVQGIDIDA